MGAQRAVAFETPDAVTSTTKSPPARVSRTNAIALGAGRWVLVIGAGQVGGGAGLR
jgi:hypothetical protein